MSNGAPITLEQLFRFKRPWGELPHQDAAVSELEEDLRANGYAEAMRRDRPWFKTWSQGGKQPEPAAPGGNGSPAWLEPALAIIKEFEGCKLTAYPDPGSGGDPWTIGWGHTGPEVKKGLQISQAVADGYLVIDAKEAADGMFQLLPMAKDWRPEQQAALISFAFNVGLGALGDSTLRRRLLAGEDPQKVVAEELPRWNKGESGVMPGLMRRRAAEVALFAKGSGQPPKGESPNGQSPNPLPVKHFAQLDSGTDQARRMCFSSSCAMLLEFLKPGTLKGANGDDQYLRRVQQFGDTTDQAAQIKALASYGVKARFTKTADFRTIEQQISRGIPVPCGYLHRGPVSSPSGGGHWLIVIGFTAQAVVVNDPLGEADLVNGTTLNSKGSNLRYSRENFGRRWMLQELPGGFYRYAPGNGWAVIAEP